MGCCYQGRDREPELPGNGVDYTGEQACATCPHGKGEQQAHPKHAAHDVRRPFELVTVDTMGPITPQALGGYSYALNLVDQLTKWKEIILMKNKTQTVKTLVTTTRA